MVNNRSPILNRVLSRVLSRCYNSTRVLSRCYNSTRVLSKCYNSTRVLFQVLSRVLLIALNPSRNRRIKSKIGMSVQMTSQSKQARRDPRKQTIRLICVRLATRFTASSAGRHCSLGNWSSITISRVTKTWLQQCYRVEKNRRIPGDQTGDQETACQKRPQTLEMI